MIVVAFGHRSRVGKDSAAKFLSSALRIQAPRLNVRTISFAAKLKDITHQLYAWAGAKPAMHYENKPADRDQKLPGFDGTIVDLWVSVGEKLREVDKMTWICPVTRVDFGLDVLIVPDLRHTNEFEELRTRPFTYLCKVTNSRVPRREGKSIDDMLETETRWHLAFENEGTLKDLNTQMTDFATHLIKEHSLGKTV